MWRSKRQIWEKGTTEGKYFPDQNGPDQRTRVKDRNVTARGRWVW